MPYKYLINNNHIILLLPKNITVYYWTAYIRRIYRRTNRILEHWVFLICMNDKCLWICFHFSLQVTKIFLFIHDEEKSWRKRRNKCLYIRLFLMRTYPTSIDSNMRQWVEEKQMKCVLYNCVNVCINYNIPKRLDTVVLMNFERFKYNYVRVFWC